MTKAAGPDPHGRCRPVSEPDPVMVVDADGLRDLVARLADEEYYGFDTEFHTERTYVPDLALIQIAWGDRVALVDPLAVDPAPLAEVFGGPGTAVAHASSQDLDVLIAACGAVPAAVFDTQIVAGFLGMSTPSLARLTDQMLGISLPKADRLSDWLERPMSERQIAYAASDVAHLLELRAVLTDRLSALGRLEWALDECEQVLGDRTPARDPEEAWWKLGDIRSMSRRSAAWPRRWPPGANARRPRPTAPAAWCCRTSACWPFRSDRRATVTSCGAPAVSTPRHLAQGRAAEILRAVERGLTLPAARIRMPSEGREAPAPAAAVAVCTGVVRQIADDLDFDQGLLATRADLAQLLCGEPSRLDAGWRRQIVGVPLRRLIVGQVGVSLGPRHRVLLEERASGVSAFDRPPLR